MKIWAETFCVLYLVKPKIICKLVKIKFTYRWVAYTLKSTASYKFSFLLIRKCIIKINHILENNTSPVFTKK